MEIALLVLCFRSIVAKPTEQTLYTMLTEKQCKFFVQLVKRDNFEESLKKILRKHLGKFWKILN